jgi:outer membrane lipoprotein-sorting protein
MPHSIRRFSCLFLACAVIMTLLPGTVFANEQITGNGLNQADQEVIEQIEDYLGQITTATASFIQRHNNGETATGEFYLSRPGKLRFAYETPNESFVVADGTFIYFWDAELEQVSQTTISQTLAYVLLQDQIDLNTPDPDDPGAVAVRGLLADQDEIVLALELANDPGQGQLTVAFQAEPLMLKRWTVLDAQGYQTIVEMNNWREGVPLSRDLFFFSRPGFGGVQ